MSISSGTRLGPYEIVESIGAGGMGEVWRAKDTRLDREVAIKVLPPGLSQDEQFLQRFEREARAISSLNHPHVCTLYDVGEASLGEGDPAERNEPSGAGTTHYLVMELIEGESLADRLRKGPLPLHDVLKYGRQIASALDAAHKRGVIHRDLKPGNVMITKSGAKLLDFGLAKSAAEGGGALGGLTNLPTEAKPLTQEGTILGTFQYMSPEQLEGIEADPRADIFALGAVLYEMATGRRAFQGETRTSLIAAIVSQHPEPISQVTPMTPPALDHVVRRCLEKDPDDRWQSAQDIASELQWISEAGSQAGVATPITRRRRSRERLAWIAVAVLVLITASSLWFALQPRSVPEPRGTFRAHLLPPKGTTFEFADRDAGSLVLSPDGSRLVFTAVGDKGERSLWVRPLDSTSPTPLAGTDGAVFPFWSPDGTTIGFFAGGKLKKIDVGGGAAITICDAPDGRGGAWNEEGVIVFSPNPQSGLHKVSANGGNSVEITNLKTGGFTSHRFPFFLPDQRRFLFTATSGFGTESSWILVGSLDADDQKPILQVRSKGILADGYLLFVKDSFVMAQKFDTNTAELQGGAFPVAEGVLYITDMSTGVFTAADGGTLAYYEKDISELVLAVYDRNGEELRTLGEPGHYGFIRFSPDAKRVAVTLTGETGSGSDIWIFDLESGNRSRLTFEEGDDVNPVWSPDGERIAYASYLDGNAEIFIRSSRGGTDRQLLMQTSAAEEPWDWSPDGRYILYNHIEGTETGLWAVPVDGGDPFPLVEGPGLEGWGFFSPDGRWVAYISNESGRWQAYATRFPAGGKWQLTSDAEGAYWIVDWVAGGNELHHITSGQMFSVLRVEPGENGIRVGSREPLMKFGGDRTWTVSEDGERFVFARSEEEPGTIPVTLVTNWLDRAE